MFLPGSIYGFQTKDLEVNLKHSLINARSSLYTLVGFLVPLDSTCSVILVPGPRCES